MLNHLIVICVFSLSSAQEMCIKEADIAFVIDSSSSIWEPNFNVQIDFLYNILNMFDISPSKTQVAAVSFSNIINPEFQFKTFRSKDKVLAAIKRIRYTKGSATRTYKALQYMNEQMFTTTNGARDGVVKIAIVMTDGETNPGRYDGELSLEEAKEWTLEEAKIAKGNGVFVFAVGVGNRVNDKELKGIASEPKSEYLIKVTEYKEFQTKKLEDLLTNRTCAAGRTTTQTPEQKEQCLKLVADVIFAIDQSSSIDSQKNFNLELDFVGKVLRKFDVGEDETRVGAVVFSDEAERVLDLKDGVSKDDALERVMNITWGKGNTFIDKAFVKMREGFSKENGGRPGQVPQIAVLVTDGVSTDPYQAMEEAGKLKSQGVDLFTIGVKNAKLSELNALSSDPDSQHVFDVGSLEALSSIVSRLSSSVCSSGTD